MDHIWVQRLSVFGACYRRTAVFSVPMRLWRAETRVGPGWKDFPRRIDSWAPALAGFERPLNVSHAYNLRCIMAQQVVALCSRALSRSVIVENCVELYAWACGGSLPRSVLCLYR
jgi:hypothetical protein